MGTLSFFLSVFAVFFISQLSTPQMPSNAASEYMTLEDNDSIVTFDRIQNELSEDGEWIKVNEDEIDAESVTDESREFDDNLNTEYVWRPHNVEAAWSLYSNGYWSYTSCGWMWNSYDRWGWRTSHYGRWWYSSRLGCWVWSPGYIWAPAWVVWMFDDDYCGWYPLSPRVRCHDHHYSCNHVRFRVRHWTFCHRNSFNEVTSPRHRLAIDPGGNHDILTMTKFRSNIEVTKTKVINAGPPVNEIEKNTGRKIKTEVVNKYNNVGVVNGWSSNDDKNNNGK